MNTRYVEVYRFSSVQHQPDTTLLLLSGVLLRDEYTRKMLALLKFQNIGEQVIRAVNVKVTCFDAFGQRIEGVEEFKYQGVNVSTGCIFGDKQPILLPDDSVSRIEIMANMILQADGTVQANENGSIFADLLGNRSFELTKDLLDQLNLEIRSKGSQSNAVTAPQKTKALWQCYCGQWNLFGQESCVLCHVSSSWIAEHMEPEGLKERLNARIRAEQQTEHERQNRARIAKEKDVAEKRESERVAEIARIKQAKAKRRVSVLAAIVSVSIIAVVIVTQIIQPKQRYDAAIAARLSGDFDASITAFEGLGAYGDAAEQVKESQYLKADSFFRSGDYEEAYKSFSNLTSYKDSDDRIKESLYQRAKTLLEEEDFDEASSIFLELKNYKDSSRQQQESLYRKAKKLLMEKHFGEAFSLFIQLGKYEDSANLAKESAYLNGLALTASEKYEDAAKIFVQIKEYKDSAVLLESNVGLFNTEIAKRDREFSIGKIVQFGNYEQDNNYNNGPEIIRWRVLAREGSKALLISVYGLFTSSYHDEYKPITWNDCTLRERLNESFFTHAFSKKHQSAIQKTVENKSSKDKIFVLSVNEAKTLFKNDNDRIGLIPATIRDQFPLSDKNGWQWWLRTQSDKWQNHSAVVDSDGSISTSGSSVFDEYHPLATYSNSTMVRPAFWIDIAFF